MFDKETVIEAGGYWHKLWRRYGTYTRMRKINA
jgi:hypothetical protein